MPTVRTRIEASAKTLRMAVAMSEIVLLQNEGGAQTAGWSNGSCIESCGEYQGQLQP